MDVGGPAKGFHAVALKGARLVAKTRTRDASSVAAWCKTQGAAVVAIDAPCRWRTETLARAAERQMAAEGITCYYAPTQEKAREHAFYKWMIPGSALYEALTPDFSLYLGEWITGPVCIETFPPAVACALAGELVSAKEKRALRGGLLERAGFSLTDLANIDEIDAALCALAAESFARRAFKSYGDPKGGFIIVPSTRVARKSAAEDWNASRGVSSAQKNPSAALEKILALLPTLTVDEKRRIRSQLDDT